jgi:hypothetical protein
MLTSDDAPATRPRCMLTAARMRLTDCTCKAVRGIASASAAAKQASRSSMHGSLSTSAVSPMLQPKNDDFWTCLQLHYWLLWVANTGLCMHHILRLSTILSQCSKVATTLVLPAKHIEAHVLTGSEVMLRNRCACQGLRCSDADMLLPPR